ncbi:MAG: SDR family NAD(P)-dependent oxidoreductase, partial [Marinomonas sp.]
MYAFTNQTILLTGATGGIGQALAHQLTQQGAHVLATGRAELPLQSLAATAPDQITQIVADLNTRTGRNHIIAVAQTHPLTGVIHNAGLQLET